MRYKINQRVNKRLFSKKSKTKMKNFKVGQRGGIML